MRRLERRSRVSVVREILEWILNGDRSVFLAVMEVFRVQNVSLAGLGGGQGERIPEGNRYGSGENITGALRRGL